MPIENASCQWLVALLSGLVGSLIGGSIAAYGAVQSVNRLEYFRRRERLESLLRGIQVEIGKVPHPAALVDNREIDCAIADTLGFMPAWKRRSFRKVWEHYRHDKEHEAFPPTDYTKISPGNAGKLMQDRLEAVLSILR